MEWFDLLEVHGTLQSLLQHHSSKASILQHSGWMKVHEIVQKAVIKTIPKRNKCKKAKWLSEEALQIAEKRKEVKGNRGKEKHTHLNAVSKNSKESCGSWGCKESDMAE